MCAEMTEDCTKVENGLVPKMKKARLVDSKRVLDLLFEDARYRAKGAKVFFSSSYLSPKPAKRSRMIKRLKAKGWVKKREFRAYESPQSGKWGIPGSRKQDGGRPETIVEVNPTLASWDPFSVLAKVGFDTRSKLSELATCLEELGMIERLATMELKLAIPTLLRPELGPTVNELGQRLQELYDSEELDTYVTGVRKAFLTLLDYASEFGPQEPWAVINAQRILGEVAIYAGRAKLQLGDRKDVPTVEIIKMGAS